MDNKFVMTRIRSKNSNYLTSLGRNAKGEATPKVANIITLYSQGKISQLQTAENMILKLVSIKDDKKQKSAFKQYDKLVNKHQSKEPLNKRLKQAKTIKPFIINVMLYKVFKREKDETDEEYKQRKRGVKLRKGVYEQIAILSLTVKAEEQTLKEALEKLLEKVQEVGSDDTSELFQQMENILKQMKI